jgi:hypothetical protein
MKIGCMRKFNFDGKDDNQIIIILHIYLIIKLKRNVKYPSLDEFREAKF